MMKFRCAGLFVLCALLCAPVFAQSKNKDIGFFYGSIGTGGAFYGSQKTTDRNDSLKDKDFSRIILALSGGGALILADPLYVTLGVDSILDFNTGGTKYANYLDCSLAAGIRVYPGLLGFFASVEYCVGTRTDIIRLEKDSDAVTPWGNGFRLSAAYDFSHLTGGFAPSIGAAWKHMPRGEDTNDDYLTVYLSIGFGGKKR